MAIEWQDTLAIEVIDIDVQHKLLFDKVNTFLAACNPVTDQEEVNRLFWFLQAYAMTHFKDEERVMQEVGYPDLAKHRERHIAFAKDVERLKERLRAEGPTNQLITSASLFISDWLFDHISRVDRAIGEFVKATRES